MFNGLLLVVCLPLTGPIFRVVSMMVRDNAAEAEIAAQTSALDPDALQHPKRAFSCAVRELVHLSGRVEAIHRKVLPLFETFDDTVALKIRSENQAVAERSLKLRIYLASIRAKEGEDAIGTRAIELAGIAANVESAADIISRKMGSLAERMNLENLKFSKDGWQDLTSFHDTVYRNMQMSISVLMNEDPSLARALVEQAGRQSERPRAVLSN